MNGNPFLGPQPYRAGDHDRFLGRGPLLQALVNRIGAHACVTLYGHSGAGKSSLMQAGVIPLLERERDCRTVRIDGWPTEEPPLERLVQTLFKELSLESPPQKEALTQELTRAVDLFNQRSERPPPHLPGPARATLSAGTGLEACRSAAPRAGGAGAPSRARAAPGAVPA